MQSFWRRVRYLFLCLLATVLICIPLAIGWAAFQAIDDQPMLTQSAPFSPARIASAKRLVARNNPRLMQAGVLRSIQLGEDDVNLAAAYLASRYPQLRLQVTLQDGQAVLRSSSFLPPNPFGNYLNVQARLRETAGLPQVEQLQLGRLNVPPRIADLLLRYGLSRLQGSAVATASDSIRHVGLRNGLVTVEFVWNDALPAQLQAAVLSPDEQARLQAYQAKLVELVSAPAAGRNLPLSTLLQPLLELAAQRSADGHVADEQRAALVALAFYVNGKGLGAILPSARDWPVPVPRHVTLGGRGDTAQHFSISAALAATAGSPLANAVGLYKELDDGQGGSGFSFNDLAADRAGTRLGELAIGNALRQQNLQKRLAAGLRDTDLLPKVQDLPEDMQTAEFQKRFGGVDGIAYKKMAADIEQRIAALALYR
ncbi:hypothetical protein [Rhodoferax sp.]|uniref:hypothetical protein n=1 Tax=Rhodoferax sp. TaxID=50421 RepID=UPI00374CC08C